MQRIDRKNPLYLLYLTIILSLKIKIKMSNFTHINAAGNPSMVDVGDKKITKRTAKARAIILLSDEILENLQNGDIQTKKGSVFQAAILRA